MFEKSIEAMQTVKNEILEEVRSGSAGSSEMEIARNTITFLDTAYMWLATLRLQLLAKNSALDEAAGGPAAATQVNFKARTDSETQV